MVTVVSEVEKGLRRAAQNRTSLTKGLIVSPIIDGQERGGYILIE